MPAAAATMKWPDGKDVTLRFTYNALCEVEAKTKQSFSALLESGSFSAIRWLTWAGLKHARHDLTLDHAGSVIDKFIEIEGNTFAKFSEALIDTMKANGFVAEEEEPTGPPADGDGGTNDTTA